jgi:hypothetical protein
MSSKDKGQWWRMDSSREQTVLGLMVVDRGKAEAVRRFLLL